MRERYIRQVGRKLQVPRNMRKEIFRDLEEIFASALENGETEQQVIDRLGTPEEFAASTAEQLGINTAALRRRKRMALGAAILAFSAIFAVYGGIRAGGAEPEMIGQADAMTGIKIGGEFGVDIFLAILAIGIAAAVFAVIWIIRAANQKRRQ